MESVATNTSAIQILGDGKAVLAFPNDSDMQVSHETIYRSLFIQARGVLKKELVSHLRSRRMMRRSGAGGNIGADAVAFTDLAGGQVQFMLGMAPVGNSPADFTKEIAVEYERWGKVVAARKLQAN